MQRFNDTSQSTLRAWWRLRAVRCIGVCCGWVLVLCGSAQALAQAASETVGLWPTGTLPQVVHGPETVAGASGAVSNISNPRIEIYRAAHPNGAAALIIGGGGYARIQIGREARPMARWLASMGVTSAVLYYRLPADGWKAEAPFQDAQRAMRLMRSRAPGWGVDPRKIGVIGFSAGANLAGITATRWDHDFYTHVDAADGLSSRPDFLAMLYPVVSMKPPLDKTRSARELSSQADDVTAYSVEEHVRPDMPPVFLAQAVDDPVADIGHSLLMYQRALKAKVPVELHAFEHGGHGWGMGKPGTEPAQWPRLWTTWARVHGFMPSASSGGAQTDGAQSSSDESPLMSTNVADTAL